MAGGRAAKWEYYVQEFDGVWGGNGAVILGLSGAVTQREFNALTNNKMPGTGEKLTVRMRKIRRSVYDICFDVPKSLSIYMAETGDKRMMRLVQEAVRETMIAIEQRMETRVQKDYQQWKTRVTGNMTYATFVHTTSRPVKGVTPDPQYHVHVVAVNATHDSEEKRWKAGEFGNIKKNAPEFQAEYHARLIRKLKLNGYRVRATKDAFELSSISRELIEKFSKRRHTVNEAMREKREQLKRRAAWMFKKAKLAGVTFATTFNRVKGMLGKDTRERKSRKKLNPIEQLLSWRRQMTSDERSSVRQAMPISLDRAQEIAPHKMPSMHVISKKIDREQGRER
jgi:conjugative relaxase-like TrwC/TraI family protein